MLNSASTIKYDGLKRKLKSTFKYGLRHLGVRMQRLDTQEYLEPLLYRMISNQDDFFFIQIGANDGVSYDPIHAFLKHQRHKVRGIVVEPQGDIYDELCKTYLDFPKIEKLNVAIHNTEAEMDLYRVEPEKRHQLPLWTKGIGSFNPEHFKISGIPPHAISLEKVRCLTFKQLVEKFNITHIDLLQIDTEGYDAEIIKNIDFDEIAPKVIHFEHGLKYGTMPLTTFHQVTALLQSYGYYIMIEADDVVAYQLDLKTITGKGN